MTPTPRFTRMEPAGGWSGLMGAVTEWDRAVSFWIWALVFIAQVLLSNPPSTQQQLWLMIPHKMTIKYHYTNVSGGIRFLCLRGKTHRVALHLITAGHTMTLIWKPSFSGPPACPSFKCRIGLSLPVPFFNTSIPLITARETRTSTLKNVCCWDT